MSSLKDRVSDEVDDVRESKPFLDHLIRTVQHYGEVKGSLQAGAMTYFAFLSFFPVLALSFAVVGGAARVFPDIQDTLVEAISRVLPGILGEGEGQISLQTIQDAAPGIASVGLLVVLYSGLGWISAMRQALLVVFERSREDYPNFVIGKLRDLAALVSLGLILLVGGLLRMARAVGAEAPASIQARMQALPERRKLRNRQAGPATSYLLNKPN